MWSTKKTDGLSPGDRSTHHYCTASTANEAVDVCRLCSSRDGTVRAWSLRSGGASESAVHPSTQNCQFRFRFRQFKVTTLQIAPFVRIVYFHPVAPHCFNPFVYSDYEHKNRFLILCLLCIQSPRSRSNSTAAAGESPRSAPSPRSPPQNVA